MKLTFLGATGTVTGSKYLVQSDNKKILIDCGLFQGLKNLRLRNWQELPMNASELDAVILTHAHIDHSGYIPKLVKSGFKGKIYCTPATFDLCRILLPDCGHIQEEDAKYANKRGYSKHQPALPLFTLKDAQESLSHFSTVQYGTSLNLSANLEIEFYNAGHILGSSHVLVKSNGSRTLFSGDIGRADDPIMKTPDFPAEAVDNVVMESTYGDRLHAASNPEEEIAQIINSTAEKGGTVIVPAFAVGRSQSVLYYVSKLVREARIPKLPIYVNSPMATNVTNIYCEHRYNHRLTEKQCHEMCDVAKYVNSVEESISLNSSPFPKVIISASGMATGGRVIHHIKAYGSDSKNTILFTGFQAAGTRGEKLTKGSRSVKIHGQEISINARVENLESLSAHADSQGLLEWLGKVPGPKGKVFITHGESSAAKSLKLQIETKLGLSCEIPSYLNEASI